MVSLLFLKKEISKFSLFCMKARYLRQFIIYYLNFMLNILVLFFFNKGKWSCSLLEDKQNVKFGVFDRCFSYILLYH